MLNCEEINQAQSEEEIRRIKVWLFQENIRIQNKNNELNQAMNKFFREREQFRDEMNTLNHKMVIEQRRIREEKMFFEKKMQILQDGFQKLEEDRISFEKEKIKYEERRKYFNEYDNSNYASSSNLSLRLFSNVNNSLALKKRYRDLIKIFHPDNCGGDADAVHLINREYAKKIKELQ